MIAMRFQAHRGASACRNRGRFPAESQRDLRRRSVLTRDAESGSVEWAAGGIAGLLTVFQRRCAEPAFESFAELAHVGIAERTRDVRDRHVLLPEHLVGSVHPGVEQIIGDAFPVHPFEVLFQRGRLHAKLRCDIGYASPSAEVVRQKGFRLFGYAHLAL